MKKKIIIREQKTTNQFSFPLYNAASPVGEEARAVFFLLYLPLIPQYIIPVHIYTYIHNNV